MRLAGSASLVGNNGLWSSTAAVCAAKPLLPLASTAVTPALHVVRSRVIAFEPLASRADQVVKSLTQLPAASAGDTVGVRAALTAKVPSAEVTAVARVPDPRLIPARREQHGGGERENSSCEQRGTHVQGRSAPNGKYLVSGYASGRWLASA